MVSNPAGQTPEAHQETQREIVQFTDDGVRVKPGFYEGPRPKVYVPCCAYDWKQTVPYSATILGMAQQCHAFFAFDWNMNDGIARSRNNSAWKFLNHPEKPEFMLFLDNDIEIHPKDVDRLLAHNLPLVCGMYPKKSAELCWVFSGLPGEKVNPETKLLKVAKAGTGVMLIRRDLLELMVAKFVTDNPKTTILYSNDPSPGDTRYDFFPMHAEDGEYKSEDWFFCDRARECGVDVMMDVTVQAQHLGYIMYPLQKHLTDSEIVDICHHKYDIPKAIMSAFLSQAPKPAQFDRKGENTKAATASYLWPDELICHHGIAIDHCADVLAGAYNLPLKNSAEKPPIIIDVGANIGAFARFASARWPGATVHCYEPHPDNFKILAKVAQAIDGAKVMPHFDGVVHTTDFEPVYLPLKHGKHSCAEHSLHDVGSQNGTQTNCRFISAKDLPGGDILKISCCGEEKDILQSLHALGRLEAFEGVAVEYFRAEDLGTIRATMEGANFRESRHKPASEKRGFLGFVRKDKVPA